jgi:hypothetical protein
MMYRQTKTITIIFLLAICTGCSINHHVAENYGSYLSKNKNKLGIPKADISAKYDKSDKTLAHQYEFRAVTVGYANLWIVEFEKLLDETLKSQEIQSAFNGLAETSGDTKTKNLIIFNLIDYKYLDYGADITLNIVLKSNEEEIINKNYTSSGEGQGVQMWVGGVFGMMDAIHDSTKSAMDKILIEFINDIHSTEVSSL